MLGLLHLFTQRGQFGTRLLRLGLQRQHLVRCSLSEADAFAGLHYSSFAFMQKEERLYGAANGSYTYYNLPEDRCHRGVCSDEQRFWDVYADAACCV